MRFCWLWMDYVDPALPLTGRERRAVWWRALNIIHSQSASQLPCQPGRIVTVMQIFAPAVLAFGPMFLMQLTGRVSLLSMMIATAVAFILTWIGVTWLGQFTWKPAITAALRQSGYDLCQRCGYWLRGLGDDVKQCPECGAEREPLQADSTP